MTRCCRILTILSPLVALGACAGERADSSDSLSVLRSAAPRPTACEAEIRAFVAVSKLAKQHGDSWAVFEPAIDAMRDQILDCVEESYPVRVGI
jgi:hypothetical protein